MQLDKYALFRQGIYVERMTPAARMAKLANRLWPIATQHDLIRIGGDADGGYLLPDVLDGISACFSPGVADYAGFEESLWRERGIPSHLADHSVAGPPAGFEPRSFTRKFVGAHDDDAFMTLDSWVHSAGESGSSRDLLLQMDIEGWEYAAVLAAADGLLERFRVIVIEIHSVESWGEQHFFGLVEAFFAKLLRRHVVVHNHPNNCCGLVDLGGFVAPRVFELTLLRRDVGAGRGWAEAFPHPLDRPNLAGRADLLLPALWHGP